MSIHSQFSVGKRLALVVTVGEYDDDTFIPLKSPAKDAEAVRSVLGDPNIGQFNVEILDQATERDVRVRLFEFFLGSSVDPDDFLLVYFSCHAQKDLDGTPYIVTSDTDPSRLMLTAVSVTYINDLVRRCRSRRIVICLDCCYAAAFLKGFRSRGDVGAESIIDIFEGSGLVVIAATKSTDFAYESQSASVQPEPSLFTSAFVEGIANGNADYNHDGLITVQDAFDYAANSLRAAGSPQTPRILSEATGDLFLAIAPLPPATLPSDVRNAIASERPEIRGGAVAALARIVRSNSLDEIRIAAVQELAMLRKDEDAVVMERARRTIRRLLEQLVGRDEDIAVHSVISELIGHKRDQPDSSSFQEKQASSVQVTLGAPRDPQWYKRAVFYEVAVRSFADSTGDGTGA